MDKIFLHGMKADTLIGVYGWERERLQTLIVDLDIGVPEKAGSDDDIANTVHYAEVCETLRRHLKEQDFLLLEALAEYIADLVLGYFGAVWVHVK
ncbi:TPA: dihydroneopterin aldolase, partial [Neisseria gonorrhoeae]